MSPAEIRFERFRAAQQALFDAETRLNQRLEEEMHALEEFNTMQLGLQKLLTSKATMVRLLQLINVPISVSTNSSTVSGQGHCGRMRQPPPKVLREARPAYFLLHLDARLHRGH